MTRYRAYDYQLGRFHQIDPKAGIAPQESWAPYHYSFNNPVRHNDPMGDAPPVWAAALLKAGADAAIGAAIEYGTQVVGNVVSEMVVEGKSFGEAVSNKENYTTKIDVGDVIVSGAVSGLTGGTSSLLSMGKSAKNTIEIAGEVIKTVVDKKPGTVVEIAGINKNETDVASDVIGSVLNMGIGKSIDAEAAKATVDGAEKLADVSSKAVGASNSVSRKVITEGVKDETKTSEDKE